MDRFPEMYDDRNIVGIYFFLGYILHLWVNGILFLLTTLAGP